MSYMNKLWMAASVGVVNSHSEQAQKLKSALKSINHGKNRFFSGNSAGHGPDAADIRSISAFLNSDLGGFLSRGEEQKKQSDESLRQVMYLNCWAQG